MHNVAPGVQVNPKLFLEVHTALHGLSGFGALNWVILSAFVVILRLYVRFTLIWT